MKVVTAGGPQFLKTPKCRMELPLVKNVLWDYGHVEFNLDYF